MQESRFAGILSSSFRRYPSRHRPHEARPIGEVAWPLRLTGIGIDLNVDHFVDDERSGTEFTLAADDISLTVFPPDNRVFVPNEKGERNVFEQRMSTQIARADSLDRSGCLHLSRLLIQLDIDD